MSYNKIVESFQKGHKIVVQWMHKNISTTPKITTILHHREKTKHGWVATNYGNYQYIISHTSCSNPEKLNVGDWKVLPPIRPLEETPRRGCRQQNRYLGYMDRREN
ncbi:hypothetical protein DM860_000957 [Cuscuta australis]|uniref:Uncharacterized protein n=1 Tax=Cuscuta australis TaxID=267555 RepID=A0A328DSF4_9ASTE|nr:hypothetical protein DM860_000957 [Cuscuta australis]